MESSKDMQKHALTTTAALSLVLGLLIGVIITRHRSAPVKTSKSNDRTYAMNVVVSAVPFWRDPKYTWEKIGDTVPGVKTVFGGPKDTDAGKQIEEIEALISQKVDGIVIGPGDTKALAPAIDKAYAAGIPVVTAFTDCPSSKRITYVGLSQKNCARQIGEAVLADDPRLLQGECKTVITFGSAGIEDQVERAAGFREVIAKHSNLKLVQTVEDKYDEVKGAENIRAILAKVPDVRLILGCDCRSAAGAASALKESGRKPGEVVVTGWDYDPDVLTLIKLGWVRMSTAQYSSWMAQICFSILEAAHYNYLYSDQQRMQKFGCSWVPDKIAVPITLVTRKNVGAYGHTPI